MGKILGNIDDLTDMLSVFPKATLKCVDRDGKPYFDFDEDRDYFELLEDGDY